MTHRAKKVPPSGDNEAPPWHFENPIAAATALGGILYLIVSEGYRAALRPFGILPQEIGIDYTSTVWPAAQVFVIALLVYWALRLSPVQSFQVFVRKPSAVHVIPVALLLYLATFAAESHYLIAVQKGISYNPFPFGRLTVLPALRADEVHLTWKDGAQGKPSLPGSGLLLLGVGGGTAYVYAASTKETLRLPLNDLVVRTKFQEPRAFGGGGGPGEEQ
jgi:hypothetical protein